MKEILKSGHGSDLEISANKNDECIRVQLTRNTGFFYLNSEQISNLQTILDNAQKKIIRAKAMNQKLLRLRKSKKNQLELFG
ncbi:MAG: hypothetical protein ISR65_05775 [Bacteriovoracaceae bacterium]|nr:hypothetical protein [Bacteriovoracaceae bacterium]